MTRLLTAREVADRLGVSVEFVYRHAEGLGAVRLGRRIVRFRETHILEVMKRGL